MLAGIGLATVAWEVAGPETLDGQCLGISSKLWFVSALITAILHQAYVWIMWRSELCWSWVSRHASFPLYRIGFFILFLARFGTVIPLAIADTGTLAAPSIITWLIAFVLFIPAAWTFYSVVRYFGFIRATGADHFEPEYRIKPFVREGVFKYIPNAMYSFGMLLFAAIAMAAASKAALIISVYFYIYAWVHYLCTERPDMTVIYGNELDKLSKGRPE